MADVYPLAHRGKIIGSPYQGTHAVAFNKAGGSNNWESENAIDISTPKGTPVVAVSSGVIGQQIGSLGSGGRFAGLRLHLVTNGNEYYYAHLSKLDVHAGEHVVAGQVLGLSGEANGVQHLHFAAKTGDPQSLESSPVTGAQPQQPQAPSAPTAPAPAPSAPSIPQTPTLPTVPDTASSIADNSGSSLPDPGATQPMLLAPGSGAIADAATGGGSYVNQLWQLISSQPNASPDTLAYVQNVAAGG